MYYNNATEWSQSAGKRVLVFGMSGLGKTYLSNILRDGGDWFHYSVDYRIGTRYMGEHIVDNFKREAMRNPFLAQLLRSDSIYIASNITFNYLSPLSTYLGKPGDPDRGGIPFAEYRRRQDLHREAEIAALLDTVRFIDRARDLYGYDNFVCDSGGSICEVVNPDTPEDPVLKSLSQNMLMVWIKGSEHHIDDLVRRFDKSPKPMYYNPEFLQTQWDNFCSENKVSESKVNPDAFLRYAYRQCLDHRLPIYRAMAEKWGVTVTAEDVSHIKDVAGFDALIARTLEG